jgi:hypothetical protein
VRARYGARDDACRGARVYSGDMFLRVCVQCRRHVGVSETSCPFCGVSSSAPTVPRPVTTATRLGRAAIFAGATLTACWSGSTKSNPIEHKQVDKPVETAPGAPAPGSIRGIVRDSRTNQPLPNFRITLVQESGATQDAVSDRNGEYVFTGLEPANYTVTYQSNHPRQPAVERPVTLQPEQGERADITVYFPEPDRGPCCKPYGAPPARRRLV